MGTWDNSLPEPAAARSAQEMSMSSRSAERDRGAARPEGDDRPYTVVYDGDCNVCGRLVGVLEQMDKEQTLEIIPSSQPDVAARFPWIPGSAYGDSIQLVRRDDGRAWQGAAAIEQLLDVLPRGRLVSWVFSIPFARPLAERVYRSFAKNRHRLGCRVHGL